jgi:hypothetical protein
MYEYNAVLKQVVSGSMVELDLDLGFKTSIAISAWLYGISDDGFHTKDSDERAKAWLFQKSKDQLLQVQIFRDADGHLGKYAAVLFLRGVNLNKQMVDERLVKSSIN